MTGKRKHTDDLERTVHTCLYQLERGLIPQTQKGMRDTLDIPDAEVRECESRGIIT